jgi:hypothetical protein
VLELAEAAFLQGHRTEVEIALGADKGLDRHRDGGASLLLRGPVTGRLMILASRR